MRSIEATQIKSDQNDKFRLWKSLLDSRGIKKSGLCLVSGAKIVEEVLESLGEDPDDKVKAVLHFDEATLESLIASNVSANGNGNDNGNGNGFDFTGILLSRSLFDELDVLGTKTPLLVVETPKFKKWSDGAKSNEEKSAVDTLEERAVLLPLGDPSNLGAVIRSSVAFGFSKIVLLEESSNPFLPRAIRASSGAVFKCQLFKGPSIHKLKNETLVLDMDGEDISTFEWPKSARLLVGEEGQGVPNGSQFKKLKIEMKSDIESLNAGVASSIALYEWSKRL